MNHIHQTMPKLNFIRFLMTFLLIGLLGALSSFGAPPTSVDEANIAGKWRVSPPNHERIYVITTGRNVKIMGGSLKEKTGRLTPQQDGSYTLNLDGDAIQRIVYVAANDQLLIEYYEPKKNLERGLPPTWKRPGIRMPEK